MGCCESSPNNNNSSLLSLTQDERINFERILGQLPVHCRQDIINLVPPKQFLNAYQIHLRALFHLQRNENLLAIACEANAIKQLKRLLPFHHDHLIFAEMYKILSLCLWKIDEIQSSIDARHTVLNIITKSTPTNYTEIHMQYFQLAFIYLCTRAWKEAERCFMKAIETARLGHVLQQDCILKLEEILEATREHIPGLPVRFLNVDVHSNLGESRENFLCRIATELNSITDQLGQFNVDITEFRRLVDKQTELQITDEILNDVLKNLEIYLKENPFLCKYGITGGSLYFIAAYFKDMQMKTSSLSPTIIEAALTIIINRINEKNIIDDERFNTVKQLPFKISFTDDDQSNIAGVRVFEIKGKYSS